MVAALLTLVVSRAIFRVFVDHARDQGDDCVFPPERWATTFRSYAQCVLRDIVLAYGYDESNLPEMWYQEERQPAPSRRTLLEEVNAELWGGFTP